MARVCNKALNPAPGRRGALHRLESRRRQGPKRAQDRKAARPTEPKRTPCARAMTVDHREAPQGEPHDDGRRPCPECGRRFARRGLAAHLRQAHGVRPVALADAQDGVVLALLETLREALAALDGRIGRIEAALVGHGERRARAREAPSDARELERELAGVLEEIRFVVRSLAVDAAGAAAVTASEETLLRARLGTLRQQQAAILFRLGPAAPGGRFPDGDNPLAFR